VANADAVLPSDLCIEKMASNSTNESENRAMKNLGECDVANSDAVLPCAVSVEQVLEAMGVKITEKRSIYDINGENSQIRTFQIPIHKIFPYFLIKRNEKIQTSKKTQKNNKKIKNNIFPVFSIVGKENAKKRGRPPLSVEEKEQAKQKKLERDRLLLRQKRKILKTPEKLALRAKDKESKAKLRSTLYTPEKKILNEDAKKRMSEHRASLLTPDGCAVIRKSLRKMQKRECPNSELHY
jgi:hypothetical protein